MDVKELVNLIKNRWKLMLMIISSFIFVGCLANYLIAPSYEAKTDLLVNYTTENAESTILQTNDIEMSLRLIETYKYMLKSDRLLGKVNSQLNTSYSNEELMKYIAIESGSNSQIITIVAREKTTEKASQLANTYAKVFQEEMKTLMNLENITILNEVSETMGIKEIKLPYYMVIAITFLMGAIVSVIMIVIQVFYSDKLNTVFKAEQLFEHPNLGVIPLIKNKGFRKRKRNLGNELLVSAVGASGLLAEELRRMRTNIQFQMAQKNAQTILVTSSITKDGKSMISGNLAVVMAMDGNKTLFIDGDLRQPVGRQIFDRPERKGLTSIIAGEFQLEDVVQKAATENLSFMSAGPIPPNPAEILSSRKMKATLEKLKEQYDVIIIDTPSLGVADAVSLAGVVDGCLYVIDATHTKEAQASNDLAQLQKVNAPILGTILNKGHVRRRKVVFE